MSKQDQIKSIVSQLAGTSLQELPERLKDIRELRTGERKPNVPILFGYPSSDEEIVAYERLIATLRKPATAGRQPERFKPFDVLATHFGGHPYAMQGDDWPDCSSCGFSLNFVCQISVNIPFNDGTTERVLYVLYYCFRCRPSTTDGNGNFIFGSYWNPSAAKAIQIQPQHELLVPPIHPFAPEWAKDAYYLPSTREVDVEEIGLPIQYYLQRYDNFIADLKDRVIMIDGGPYPIKAPSFSCNECGSLFEVTFTVFQDGVFSLLCCRNHPGYVIALHTEYDDCAVGPVKFEILS